MLPSKSPRERESAVKPFLNFPLTSTDVTAEARKPLRYKGFRAESEMSEA